MVVPPHRKIYGFISDYGRYYFQEGQTSFSTNFRNLLTSVEKIPGVSGGFDNFGKGKTPQETGSIQLSIYLSPEDELQDITQLKDDLSRIVGWGKAFLFMVPENRPEGKYYMRFAECRVNNLTMSEKADDQPDVYQTAQLTLQASDQPAWLGCEPSSTDPAYNQNGWWHLDDGSVLDSGMFIGGSRIEAQIANGSELTIETKGSMAVRPYIQFSAKTPNWVIGDADVILGGPPIFTLGGAGEPLRNFGLRRYLGTRLVEEWRWDGELAVGETLSLDCVTGEVVYESSVGDINGWPEFVIVKGFGFNELPSGTSKLVVFGDFDGDAKLEVFFHDHWY
jgi:hypothetical protein